MESTTRLVDVVADQLILAAHAHRTARLRRSSIDTAQRKVTQMKIKLRDIVEESDRNDGLNDIRFECYELFEKCMMKFPDRCMTEEYLTALGAGLGEKLARNLVKVLQVLECFYSYEPSAARMAGFTTEFGKDVFCIATDNRVLVYTQAMKTAIAMLEFQRDNVLDDDCLPIQELVFAENRKIAVLAGEFVNEKYFSVSETRTAQRVIHDIVQFFVDADYRDHAAYMVDSLIESNGILSDWSSLIDADSNGDPNSRLDDRWKTAFFTIVACCVKQTATRISPRDPQPPFAIRHPVVRGTNRELTECFAVPVCEMMLKYMHDAPIVTQILMIPQYFDLVWFIRNRQQENLHSLTSLVVEVTKLHTDKKVLKECAYIFQTFCHDESPVRELCNAHRTLVMDYIAEQYNTACEMFRTNYNETSVQLLATSLTKLLAFHSRHDFGEYHLWDSLVEIVKESVRLEMPESVTKDAVDNCFFTLINERNRYRKSPRADEVDAIRARYPTFVEVCRMLMKCGVESLECKGFLSLGDAMDVMSKSWASRNAVIERIALEPDETLQDEFMDFLQQHVLQLRHEFLLEEEIILRQKLVGVYLRLLMNNAFRIVKAVGLLKFYVVFDDYYGHLIKRMLATARDQNPVRLAQAILRTLKEMFVSLPRLEDDVIDKTNEDFENLKKLAKKFAVDFGEDKVFVRKGLLLLHKECINFALESTGDLMPNIDFLIFLKEFDHLILKQEKQLIETHYKEVMEAHGARSIDQSVYSDRV